MLSSLQHLSLNFGLCQQIGDLGVASFGAGVAKLSNLQLLSLDIRWCEKIGDQGVASLAEELAKLKLLADITVVVGAAPCLTWLKSLADLQSYAHRSRGRGYSGYGVDQTCYLDSP